MVLQRSKLPLGLRVRQWETENLSQNAVRNVDLCFILWGPLFVVWEREKYIAKPFWNLLELETFLERVVLVTDCLHSDGWNSW